MVNNSNCNVTYPGAIGHIVRPNATHGSIAKFTVWFSNPELATKSADSTSRRFFYFYLVRNDGCYPHRFDMNQKVKNKRTITVKLTMNRGTISFVKTWTKWSDHARWFRTTESTISRLGREVLQSLFHLPNLIPNLNPVSLPIALNMIHWRAGFGSTGGKASSPVVSSIPHSLQCIRTRRIAEMEKRQMLALIFSKDGPEIDWFTFSGRTNFQ